jgi:calcyphosin
MMRVLKIMDDNGDGRLDRSELKWGLKDYGIVLSPAELEAVFSHFDRDRNGFVDRDEFLAGLRGPLSERRRALIAQAFSVLDSTGDGCVTVDDLKGRYNAKEHPEVRNGSKTEGQILAQFLQQWDSSKDGLVSAAEFEEYYCSVSASIDSDDYFELMMRNGESQLSENATISSLRAVVATACAAMLQHLLTRRLSLLLLLLLQTAHICNDSNLSAWHLSGGSGWCANSANKRVLVRGADGHEAVHEVQRDLGLRGSDVDGMRRRLREQGTAVRSSDGIEGYGAADTTKGQTVQPRRQQHSKQQQQQQQPTAGVANRRNSDAMGALLGHRSGGDECTPTQTAGGSRAAASGGKHSGGTATAAATAAGSGSAAKQAWSEEFSESSDDPLSQLRAILYSPPCTLEGLIGLLQASKVSQTTVQ